MTSFMNSLQSLNNRRVNCVTQVEIFPSIERHWKKMAIISLSHDTGSERDGAGRHVNALDRFHYPMTTWNARALIIEHPSRATFPHLIAIVVKVGAAAPANCQLSDAFWCFNSEMESFFFIISFAFSSFQFTAPNMSCAGCFFCTTNSSL